MAPLTRGRAAAEALTLLAALARAPAAAALVVRALERAEDRKARRLVHSQLRDAVGEATTQLRVIVHGGARPPSAPRWPRLEELTMRFPDSAALEALGAESWDRLRVLSIGNQIGFMQSALGEPAARALAAALRRMPTLHELELRNLKLPDASAAELFGTEGAAPRLRKLTMVNSKITPATAVSMAASGWRLEELRLRGTPGLGAAGGAALLAAPTFAIRRLCSTHCGLDASSLLRLANAPGRSSSWTSTKTTSATPRPGPRSRRSRGTRACAAWTLPPATSAQPASRRSSRPSGPR